MGDDALGELESRWPLRIGALGGVLPNHRHCGGDLLTSSSMLSGAVCQKNEQLVAGLARNRFRDTSRLALWDFFRKADG